MNNFNFSNAVTRDVIVNNKKEDNFQAIVNSETNKVHAITSNQYKILQHSDAFNYAFDGLKNSDYNFDVVSCKEFNDGKIMQAGFKLQEKFDFLGDTYNLMFNVKHGHTGNTAYTGYLYLMKQVCSNGMMASDRTFSFTFGHRSKIISEQITEVIELNLLKLKDYWLEKLESYNKNMSEFEMLQLIKEWSDNKLFPKKHCELMKQKILSNNVLGIDKTDNMLYLYNAGTELFSRLDNPDNARNKLIKFDVEINNYLNKEAV